MSKIDTGGPVLGLGQYTTISAYDINRHDGDKIYHLALSLLHGPIPIKEIKQLIVDVPDNLELVVIKLDPNIWRYPAKDGNYGKDVKFYFCKVIK